MDNNNEELVNTIKELQKKLEVLSAPYEDALANRVYEKSQERFKKWVGLWLAIITLGLAFTGVTGFLDIRNKVVALTENKVAATMEETIKSSVAGNIGEIDKKIDIKINEQIQPRIDEIKADLDETAKNLQKSLTDSIGNIGKKTEGYVVTDFFKKVSGSSGAAIVSGDILEAAANVNMREGNPNNVSDFKSWNVIKVLPNKTKVKVLEVYPSNISQNLVIARVESIGN